MNDGDLRIGTAVREGALAALGEHLVAGRLELPEYEQRAAAAAAALTQADLDALFADLPPSIGAGPGHLPGELLRELTTEGLLVLAADVPGTMTFRRYRGAGQTTTQHGASAVRATVAVSRARFLIWAAGGKRVDMPFDHPGWPALTIKARRGRLDVTIDAAVFHPAAAGRIAFRLETDRAAEVADFVSPR